jgi:hypothetical protein
MALEHVGLLRPLNIFDDPDDNDTRAVDALIDWFQGPQAAEMRRVAGFPVANGGEGTGAGGGALEGPKNDEWLNGGSFHFLGTERMEGCETKGGKERALMWRWVDQRYGKLGKRRRLPTRHNGCIQQDLLWVVCRYKMEGSILITGGPCEHFPGFSSLFSFCLDFLVVRIRRYSGSFYISLVLQFTPWFRWDFGASSGIQECKSYCSGEVQIVLSTRVRLQRGTLLMYLHLLSLDYSPSNVPLTIALMQFATRKQAIFLNL